MYIQCKGNSDCTYITAIEDSSVLKFDKTGHKFKSKANGSSFEDVTSTNKGYEIITSDDANKLFGLSGSKLLVYVTETLVKKGKWKIINLIINEAFFFNKNLMFQN